MQNRFSAYTSLLILYASMLSGLIAFTGIAYFALNRSEPLFFKESQRDILLIALFVATACTAVSGFLWSKDLKKVNEMIGIENKFEKYRSVAIKKFAIIEGAGIFAVICYSITGNIRFVVIAVLVIIAFLLSYPSLNRAAKDISEAEEDIKNLPA